MRISRLRSSAGLLLYRWRDGGLQVLLVHPGGPYWRNRDIGAWQIPKGVVRPDEDMLQAALREFEEEVGTKPGGRPWPLAILHQPGGKRVEVFALEGTLDPAGFVSNSFEVEWPPHSGTIASFPEVDRASWFAIGEAEQKILASQAPLLHMLAQTAPAGGMG